MEQIPYPIDVSADAIVYANVNTVAEASILAR